MSTKGNATVNIEVLPDAQAIIAAVADHFVELAAAAIKESNRFVVALAGGSTPKALYALLATPAYAPRIDWSRVHVFWGDERCVPPTDASSNFRMASEALLNHVPVPAVNIHRLRGEDDPAAAAAAYEAELRALFTTPTGPPALSTGKRFDLVLLGMGDNGHTASLFPGLKAVRENQRWVMEEYVGEVSMWRVTMTPPIINAAAESAFVVVGKDKTTMLKRVLEGPQDPDALPAQIVVAQSGRVVWFADAAAAALLTSV